jgi:hypothetical protein
MSSRTIPHRDQHFRAANRAHSSEGFVAKYQIRIARSIFVPVQQSTRQRTTEKSLRIQSHKKRSALLLLDCNISRVNNRPSEIDNPYL